MELNDWLTILGALGGLEAIKWIVNFYVNRKTDARKEDAAADAAENENERNQVAWLEERIVLNGMQRLMLFMLSYERSNLLIWKIYIKDMWQNCNLKKLN